MFELSARTTPVLEASQSALYPRCALYPNGCPLPQDVRAASAASRPPPDRGRQHRPASVP